MSHRAKQIVYQLKQDNFDVVLQNRAIEGTARIQIEGIEGDYAGQLNDKGEAHGFGTPLDSERTLVHSSTTRRTAIVRD